MARPNKKRKIKIIRVEDLTWNRKDLIIRPLMGHIGYRARHSGEDREIPFESRIRIEARQKNRCLNCTERYATKIIFLESNIKGASKIERYCTECVSQVADLNRMIMLPPEDDSEIMEKITIQPSGGASGRTMEDWKLKLGDKYKKWERW